MNQIKIAKLKTKLILKKKTAIALNLLLSQKNSTVEVFMKQILWNKECLSFLKSHSKVLFTMWLMLFVFLQKIREIFQKNDIIKCFTYLNLTHTDSCSLFSFVYVCWIVKSQRNKVENF